MVKRKGILYTLVFLLMGYLSVPPVGAAAARKVLSVTIDGAIHGGTEEILDQALEKGALEDFEAVVVLLDTPGGLISSTREIVKKILNAPLPVIVYVAPSGAHAGSAGTFITLAAHVAAMAPGTNIGAAHPVMATGKDPEEGGEHMARKVENDTAAFIETIANQRGRNAEWARKAVIESAAITETRALELGVIDIVASSLEDLLRQCDGREVTMEAGKRHVLETRDARVIPLEIGIKLKILNVLASPETIFLLLLIAGLGIYLEISHPGLVMPGVAAGIAIVLLLVATRTLPINALGIFLIFSAIALFIAEIYVTSFGLLTIAGLTAFYFGSVLLFDPRQSDLRVPQGQILGAMGALGAIALFVGFVVTRTFRKPVTSGAEGLIGRVAEVVDEITPEKEGKVFLDGEYWNAQSPQVIRKGEKVEIVERSGLRLTVRPVD